MSNPLLRNARAAFELASGVEDTISSGANARAALSVLNYVIFLREYEFDAKCFKN